MFGKVAELGEIDDFVIHGVHFFIAKAKQGAIEIDIFAAGEVWVEPDPEFNKRDEIAIDFYGAFFRKVDFGEGFEEGGFARTVATNDADKFVAMDVEIDAIEDFLFFVAFDAAKVIENSLLESPSTFSGEFETFVEIFD